MSGSRIDQNENSPDTAARRKLIVAGDKLSARRPSRRTTFEPAARPATRSVRHAAKNRNNTSVVTADNPMSSSLSHRQNANNPNPYVRIVRGE